MDYNPILPKLRKYIETHNVDLYGVIDFESAVTINRILDRFEQRYMFRKYETFRCVKCGQPVVRQNTSRLFVCYECKLVRMKIYEAKRSKKKKKYLSARIRPTDSYAEKWLK